MKQNHRSGSMLKFSSVGRLGKKKYRVKVRIKFQHQRIPLANFSVTIAV